MDVYVMLVKIEHFPEKIKYKQNDLRLYVIDYADYAGTCLEQMGAFRYRKICNCTLGKSNANKLKVLVFGQSNKKVFFCNDMTFDVPQKIYTDIINRPELYATVMFRCYL